MTGIAGFLDWKRNASGQGELLENMARSLSGTQTLQDTHLALSASSVWSRDGVSVAAEGYLYNEKEIQRDLLSAGTSLQSGQLAELVLSAYFQWGDAFVERLAGAFAFVIGDSREHRVILGRDQMGIKKLFYSDQGSAVAFGTEIKMVLEYPTVTRNVARDGLIEVLVKGPYYSPGHAVFADLREVLPGHLIICTPNGVRSVCYWKLESRQHEDSLEDTVSTIDSLLSSHVSQWGEYEVPPTIILSGGLDSSGLTAMMHRAFGREHRGWKSFSGNTAESYDVENKEDMDYIWVDRVAKHLGMTNEEVLFDLNALWEINAIPRRAHDLPIEAKYEATTYQIYSLIREQNPMIVSGEAADELFSSTYWFYRERELGALNFPWQSAKSSMFASPDLLKELGAEAYEQQLGLDYLRDLSRLPGEDDTNAKVRELTYFIMKEYLPNILRHNDRMAAASGAELRMPFVDPRLAQYVWNIPWEMKNYRDQPKGVLRQVFRKYLPDFVIDRKKSNMPMVFKSSYSQSLRAAAEALLQDRQAPLYELLDHEQVRKVLDERVIEQDLFTRWRLDYYLQIDHWMREYRVQLRV